MEVRRLAARKEELYRALLGDRTPMVPPGVTSLLNILQTNKVRHIIYHRCLFGSF